MQVFFGTAPFGKNAFVINYFLCEDHVGHDGGGGDVHIQAPLDALGIQLDTPF